MSLFDRHRRAWRALPKSKRLKPSNWLVIPTGAIEGYGDAFASIADFELVEKAEGVEVKGPIEISGYWDATPWPSLAVDLVGSGVPRRTKKAFRKWIAGDDLGLRERRRLSSVQVAAVPYEMPPHQTA